jgi:hypothetical protein
VSCHRDIFYTALRDAKIPLIVKEFLAPLLGKISPVEIEAPKIANNSAAISDVVDAPTPDVCQVEVRQPLK